MRITNQRSSVSRGTNGWIARLQGYSGDVEVYSNILVPIDLDEPSSWSKTVPVAIQISKCFGAQVTLAYVVPGTQLALEAQWSAIGFRRVIDTSRARLTTLADELSEGCSFDVTVADGNIYVGILDAAVSAEADLIILASHRPTMKDYLLGANAAKVVRHAVCSVMVVRD